MVSFRTQLLRGYLSSVSERERDIGEQSIFGGARFKHAASSFMDARRLFISTSRALINERAQVCSGLYLRRSSRARPATVDNMEFVSAKKGEFIM